MRKGQLIIWLLLLIWQAPVWSQQPIPGLAAYFEEAYWRYPNIPKGVLEAMACSATRITNLLPQPNKTNSCTCMPERYGIFGLIENGRGYFKNNLLLVCNVSNITPEQFKKDERLQILAVAKYLGREATARRMSIQVSAEEFAGMLDILSEIPDDSSEVNNYAHSLYLYDIYHHLQKGIPSLNITPTPVALNKIFAAPVLQKFKAKKVTILYNKDSVAAGEVQPDYPNAIFVQANAANYRSGRNGSKITHITIHTIQGTYAGAISWFKNPAASVSAHYVVRSYDGQITQMVRETDVAWHVRSANNCTIGIEHEGYIEQGTQWYTDDMYRSSAALVHHICSHWGIDRNTCYRGTATSGTNFQPFAVRIKGHQHYSGNTHTDPGKHWNWGKYADLLLAPGQGQDSLAVSPDPIRGNEFQVYYYLNNSTQPATLLLSDTYGRIVEHRRVQLRQGNNRLNINTSFLQAGVYHVTVQLDGKGGGVSKKIVKQ
jgi:Negative regulator of beta-lactamase expression